MHLTPGLEDKFLKQFKVRIPCPNSEDPKVGLMDPPLLGISP